MKERQKLHYTQLLPLQDDPSKKPKPFFSTAQPCYMTCCDGLRTNAEVWSQGLSNTWSSEVLQYDLPQENKAQPTGTATRTNKA